MKKNVKVIASLVRKAKKKLYQGKRDEALELMRKAVNLDDNSGVLVQVIRVIGKKRVKTGYEDDIDEDEDNGVIAAPEPPAEVEDEQAEDIEDERAEDIEDEQAEDIEDEQAEYIEDDQVMDVEDEQVEDIEDERAEDVEDEQAEDIEDEPELLTGDFEYLGTEDTGDGEEEYEVSGGRSESVEENEERKQSMAEDRLQKLFEASDMEYEKGQQQKAIAYLKKARQLAPDNPEVSARIDLLKTRIKAANLVQIAIKKLRAGDAAAAVSLARQAFEMMPSATGLEQLLSELESTSAGTGAEMDFEVLSQEGAGSGGSTEVSAQEYIAQIRQMVQDNALVAAAELAERAYSIHSDDSLLAEFVENFRKLGLLE